MTLFLRFIEDENGSLTGVSVPKIHDTGAAILSATSNSERAAQYGDQLNEVFDKLQESNHYFSKMASPLEPCLTPLMKRMLSKFMMNPLPLSSMQDGLGKKGVSLTWFISQLAKAANHSEVWNQAQDLMDESSEHKTKKDLSVDAPVTIPNTQVSPYNFKDIISVINSNPKDIILLSLSHYPYQTACTVPVNLGQAAMAIFDFDFDKPHEQPSIIEKSLEVVTAVYTPEVKHFLAVNDPSQPWIAYFVFNLFQLITYSVVPLARKPAVLALVAKGDYDALAKHPAIIKVSCRNTFYSHPFIPTHTHSHLISHPGT